MFLYITYPPSKGGVYKKASLEMTQSWLATLIFVSIRRISKSEMGPNVGISPYLRVLRD